MMLENKLGGGKNMFEGDKKTQLWARRALPILAKKVQERETISYTQLAHALGLYSKTHPVNMGKVCANISATLHDLEERYEEKLPRIASIVIKKTGKLSPWMCQRLTGDPDKQPSQEIFHSELEHIYDYPKWDEILQLLNLSTAKLPIRQLQEYAARRRDTHESHAHKCLKNYVANHPEIIGLNKSLAPGKKEVELPSGDRVDVLFRNEQCCIAVEVKSRISDKGDLTRGIYQCIKYREILKARSKVNKESHEVDALLAIESTLPIELIGTRDTLGVTVIESIRVKGK